MMIDDCSLNFNPGNVEDLPMLRRAHEEQERLAKAYIAQPFETAHAVLHCMPGAVAPIIGLSY